MTHRIDFITKPQLPPSSDTFYSSYYLEQKHAASGNTNVIFGVHCELNLNDLSYFANFYGYRLVLTKFAEMNRNMCVAVHIIMYLSKLWYMLNCWSQCPLQLQQYEKKIIITSSTFHSELIWWDHQLTHCCCYLGCHNRL